MTAHDQEWTRQMRQRFHVGLLSLTLAVVFASVVYWAGFGRIRSWGQRHANQRAGATEVGALRCETPVYDFGTVDASTAGLKLRHVFSVTNLSDDARSIARVRSSCGCMLVDGYKKQIEASGNTQFKLVLSLPPTPGPFRKTVIVDIVGFRRPMVFELHGVLTGVRPLGVAPALVNFGNVTRGDAKERTIVVLRYEAIDTATLSVRSADPHVRCDVVKGHDGARVQVTLQTTELPLGKYDSELVIESHSAKLASVAVPVTAFID